MENKETTVTLGLQNMPGQGPIAPNARIVMVQPSATMPDGSVRELQPYEVTVVHRIHPVDGVAVFAALLLIALVHGLLRMDSGEEAKI